MHEACLDCVRKHLAQAMIMHEEEVPLGYPEHIDRVIGHLAEASRESIEKFPQLSSLLRDHRIKIMEDDGYYPPYPEIIEYVRTLIELQESSEEVEIPDPPADLLVPDPI
jgi:hypothetical protein